MVRTEKDCVMAGVIDIRPLKKDLWPGIQKFVDGARSSISKKCKQEIYQELYPIIEKFLGRKENKILNLPGWYVWVCVNGEEKRVVYVGKAGGGEIKQSLNTRIWKELQSEYPVGLLYEILPGSNKAKEAGAIKCMTDAYPKTKGKEKALGRGIKKGLSTHIIWHRSESMGISEKEARAIESFLMGALQPEANIEVVENGRKIGGNITRTLQAIKPEFIS